MAWKTLKSKIIHENPWYSIREDDVIRPDGNNGKYYVIDSKAVAVIAEDADGKIFLVGQTRYPVGNIYSWEVITGGIKKGTTALETAKDELREEVGLIAKDWQHLGFFNPTNGISSEQVDIFLAKIFKKTDNQLEPTEDISVNKKSIREIIEMISDNKITCGITAFSIFKYILHKQNEKTFIDF